MLLLLLPLCPMPHWLCAALALRRLAYSSIFVRMQFTQRRKELLPAATATATSSSNSNSRIRKTLSTVSDQKKCINIFVLARDGGDAVALQPVNCKFSEMFFCFCLCFAFSLSFQLSRRHVRSTAVEIAGVGLGWGRLGIRRGIGAATGALPALMAGVFSAYATHILCMCLCLFYGEHSFLSRALSLPLSLSASAAAPVPAAAGFFCFLI